MSMWFQVSLCAAGVFRLETVEWLVVASANMHYSFESTDKFLRQDKGNYAEALPSSEPGSILKLVQQLVSTNSTTLNYPCITMVRLLFGSVETQEHDWTVSIPSRFNRKQFETLRWRHHGPTSNKKMHGYPKVLVDVSKIPMRYLSKDIIYSIHRPFKQFCRGMGEVKYADFEKFPITTNHYLGSWERYNARGDTRRSRDVSVSFVFPLERLHTTLCLL